MRPTHTRRIALFAVLAILADCVPLCLAARIHFASPAYTAGQSDGTLLSAPRGGAILGQPSVAALEIDDAERPVALDPSFDSVLGPAAWVSGYFGLRSGLFGLIRLNPDGSLDPTLHCPNLSSVTAVQAQPNGDIVVAGGFTEVDGVPRNHLARIFCNTALHRSVEWSQLSYSVDEDATNLVVAVLRGGDSSKPLTVQYATHHGSATGGMDFVAQSGTITLAAGENSRELSLAIVDDGTMEDTESFQIVLRNPSPGVLIGARSQAQVDIRDSEISAMIDSTFSPEVPRGINAVAFQADGKLLLGGAFRRVDGVRRTSLARLNTDGSLDTTFEPDFAPANELPYVRALAIQPDGRIIVGGHLERAGGPAGVLARLNPDGSPDRTFNPPAEFSPGAIEALALQPDGKLLVGSYSERDGRLRRLNTDGTPDLAFRSLSRPWISVTLISPQADGKILVGMVGSEERVTRLNADGSPDLSYMPALCGSQAAAGCDRVLAFGPDGKAIVAGYDGARTTLARLNADGSRDGPFQFDAPSDPRAWTYASIDSVAVAPDGNLLVTGRAFKGHRDSWSSRLSRFKADGSLDSRFPQIRIGDPYGSSRVNLDAGRVIISGSFEGIGGHPQANVAVLRPERSSATAYQFARGTFVAGESEGASLITVQRVGDVSSTTTVQFGAVSGTAIPGQDFLPLTGSLTFAPLENTKTFRVAILDDSDANPDRTVLLSLSEPGDGAFLSRAHATLRILDDDHPGSLDVAFKDAGLQPGPGSIDRPWPNGVVERIDVLPDGKIRLWGGFAGRFAHLDADGSRDQTHGGMPPHVLAYGPDGTSYGYSRDEFSFPSGAFSRFHADGSVDPSFQVTMEPDSGRVGSAAVLADGRLVVGGSFNQLNGVRRRGVARLNPDGSIDPAFDPGTGVRPAEVLAIAPQADGRIVVGGAFTSVSGTARDGLARLNADGSLDPTFVSIKSTPKTPDAVVFSLASLPDGTVLALGAFPALDPTGARMIVRFKANGAFASILDLDTGTLSGIVFDGYHGTREGYLMTMALQPDGGLLVGGEFRHINGVARYGLARLKPLGMAEEPPHLEAAASSADGAILLGIHGQPDGTYRIETSVDLREWTLLKEVASAGALTLFRDSAPASSSRKFYRVMRP